MSDKAGKLKPTEIRVCNVVYYLKALDFSLTVPGVSATTTRPDGGEDEFVFGEGFTHDEVASHVFRHLGLSATPPFKIRKAPRKAVTCYIKKLEAS